MDKKTLRWLATGLYRDAQGVLYVYIQQFLTRHGLPDRPEVRRALLEQIKEEFGEIEIVVIEEGDPES